MYGCFNHHLEYLGYIVFPNAMDFNYYYNDEYIKNSVQFDMEVYRHFSNAIESMNNIVDYIYFDHFECLRNISLAQFRTNLNDSYPILRNVNDIANAYKHCVRAGFDSRKSITKIKKDKLSAAQMNDISISSKIELTREGISSNTTISSRFSTDLYNVFMEGFEFWIQYNNNQDRQESFLNAGMKL